MAALPDAREEAISINEITPVPGTDIYSNNVAKTKHELSKTSGHYGCPSAGSSKEPVRELLA